MNSSSSSSSSSSHNTTTTAPTAAATNVNRLDQLHTELVSPERSQTSDIPKGPLVLTVVSQQIRSDMNEEALNKHIQHRLHQLHNEEIYKHRKTANIFIPVVNRKKE